jgi:hypothetical protein
VFFDPPLVPQAQSKSFAEPEMENTSDMFLGALVEDALINKSTNMNSSIRSRTQVGTESIINVTFKEKRDSKP